MLLIEATPEAWFAEIRARIRFGIAIAAMIRIIATTISSSISEKPFCLRMSFLLPSFPFSGIAPRFMHANFQRGAKPKTEAPSINYGSCAAPAGILRDSELTEFVRIFGRKLASGSRPRGTKMPLIAASATGFRPTLVAAGGLVLSVSGEAIGYSRREFLH